MTERYFGAPPSQTIRAGMHSDVLAVLPEYVMIRALGQQPPPEWQVLEQHLASCSACRREADELTRLVMDMYAGVFPLDLAPPPDLTFLPERRVRPTAEELRTPARTVLPIVMQFS